MEDTTTPLLRIERTQDAENVLSAGTDSNNPCGETIAGSESKLIKDAGVDQSVQLVHHSAAEMSTKAPIPAEDDKEVSATDKNKSNETGDRYATVSTRLLQIVLLLLAKCLAVF
jgi:hypothetical protein